MFVELVVGVGFEGKELCAYAVNREGESSHFPVEDLYRRGMLDGSRQYFKRISTNYCEWELVSPTEYLQAFGFSVPASVPVEHQFYEFTAEDTRFVVPALLLMREVFRPCKFLLAEMFRPHAFEMTTSFEVSPDGTTAVQINAGWATSHLSRKQSDWTAAVAWMRTHPSAKKMVSSVHLHALSGTVGLDLPLAKCQMICRGLRLKNTLFVTDLVLTTVSPLDVSELVVVQPLSTLQLHANAPGCGAGQGRVDSSLKVPARFDGGVVLTDSEWELVEPVLMSNRKCKHSFKLDPRLLLDGILEKLASGNPWRTAQYRVGTWGNARTAFRDWSLRGVFIEVIHLLETTRKAP